MALLKKDPTAVNMAQTHLEGAASLAEAMLGWKIPTVAVLHVGVPGPDRGWDPAAPAIRHHDCGARLRHLHTTTARLAGQEMVLLTRLRQARHWSGRAARDFPLIRTPLTLFTGAMGILDDAVRDIADVDQLHFDDPASTGAFLLSRGLLEDMSIGLDEVEALEPMASFQFFGLLPLADVAVTARTTAQALHRFGGKSDELPPREDVIARYGHLGEVALPPAESDNQQVLDDNVSEKAAAAAATTSVG